MADLYQYLDTTGDGTGTKLANVDGSSTPVVFKYVPGARDRTKIHRLLVHVSDTAPISADEYGGVTALTNGVLIQVRKQVDDSVVRDLLGGLPIKANTEWSRVCFDMEADNFGSGSDSVKVRWTFTKSGAPLYIQNDEYFCAVVQDNLTGLLSQTFNIQGQIERY